MEPPSPLYSDQIPIWLTWASVRHDQLSEFLMFGGGYFLHFITELILSNMTHTGELYDLPKMSLGERKPGFFDKPEIRMEEQASDHYEELVQAEFKSIAEQAARTIIHHTLSLVYQRLREGIDDIGLEVLREWYPPDKVVHTSLDQARNQTIIFWFIVVYRSSKCL